MEKYEIGIILTNEGWRLKVNTFVSLKEDELESFKEYLGSSIKRIKELNKDFKEGLAF